MLVFQGGDELLHGPHSFGQELAHTPRGLQRLGKFSSPGLFLRQRPALGGFLQQRVGRELRMKRTPTLTFVHDDSIDTGMRITELLSEVEPRGGE